MVRCAWKPCGYAGDLQPDLLEHLERRAGMAAARIVGVARRLDVGPAAVEPVGAVGLVTLACLQFGIEPRAPVRAHLLDFAFGDEVLAHELLGVDLARGRVLADRLVHQGLGERGLVAFVVPEAPVAEHVDDDGALELLPELGRDFGGIHHRLGIVAVHMEDRRLDHLGDVGRIRRRTRVTRVGGEPDLVVDDEMHGATGAVAAQPRQAEALGDHALPGKGRVARNEQRHDHRAVFPGGAELILLGAHLAQHHRIDDFEMRRIGGERKMNAVAVKFAIGRGAEVIFHVA